MFVKVYPMFVKRYAKLFQPKPNKFPQHLTIYKVIMSIYGEFHQRNGSLSKTMDYGDQRCRNPSLGLTTKAKVCKGANQIWSPGITFHVLENARKCEGMNPHTLKWAPALGVGVSMDSRIFIKQFQGSKSIGLKRSLYHWKTLGT